MNEYIKNFYQLFSEDDNEVYQALILKKDWILHSFYLICSLDSKNDIEDILQGRIKFKKLMINPYLYDDNQELTLKNSNLFNDKYRVLYLNETKPIIDGKREFILKLDFNKLMDNEYKLLFANFYPTIEEEIIKKELTDDEKSLILSAMDRGLGENVIIIDKQYLKDDYLYIHLEEEIIFSSILEDKFKEVLKQLSKILSIKYKEE